VGLVASRLMATGDLLDYVRFRHCCSKESFTWWTLLPQSTSCGDDVHQVLQIDPPVQDHKMGREQVVRCNRQS
jgi:hypothetical protein